MSEIIYKRTYPRETLEEALTEARLAEAPQGHLPPFQEFYQQMLLRQTRILLPERAPLAEEFISLAIKTGETYEIDTRITRDESHISVEYRFDCGGELDALLPLLRRADSVSFFTGIDGFDLTLVLDFYTHAVYQGDRLLHPRPL